MDKTGAGVRGRFALGCAAFAAVATVLPFAIVWWVLAREAPASVSSCVLALVPAFLVLTVVGLLGGWMIAGRALDAMLVRLEAHDAEQSRFAANVSHELRTPLAITQVLLDVARSDPTRPQGELIERLRAVNTRAIQLIEAMLVLSRADRRSFARDTVDLSIVAEEATESLLPLAESRGVALETSGEVVVVLGSTPLLLQLVTNLVHNAIVHNVPERGTVRLTTSAEAATAVVTVENTGGVIDPRVLPTLTEPFRRGTGRASSGHAGTGLGLAIVKSIVEAHDGVLTLAARPDGGLRVTVELPSTPAASTRGARSRPTGLVVVRR